MPDAGQPFQPEHSKLMKLVVAATSSLALHVCVPLAGRRRAWRQPLPSIDLSFYFSWVYVYMQLLRCALLCLSFALGFQSNRHQACREEVAYARPPARLRTFLVANIVDPTQLER